MKNIYHNLDADEIFVIFSKLIGWLLIFINPLQSIMGAIVFLAIADLVTAIWAAIKNNKRFGSHSLRKTVNKILAYEVAVVLSYVVENVFNLGIPVVRLVAGLIAVTELKSNLENLYHITGLDYWQKILEYIRLKKKEEIPSPSSTPQT